MSAITIRNVYAALGTYGANGQIIYSNGAEIGPIVKIDLKKNRMERKIGGSSRTYDRSRYTSVTMELEAMTVYLNTYTQFMGHQRSTVQDSEGHEVEGYAVTGMDIAPELGVMFTVDTEDEVARAALNLPYSIENRWAVVRVFKATMASEGISASTLISGEAPSDDTVKITISGVMLNSPGKNILDVHCFKSEGEATAYTLRTMGVHMNLAVEVNPDAEQEQDRVVNLNLEAGRRYSARDIIELIQDPLGQNRPLQQLLISGTERAVDYLIPGVGWLAGAALRAVWGQAPQQEENV